MLNHDLHNTRHQHQETVIGPGEAVALSPAWKFSASSEEADGATFQSTPIVSEGCVYVASDTTGWVFALNADTGALVWKTKLDGNVLGLAAANGRLYAFPYGGTPGPHAVALNQLTGAIAWQTGALAAPPDPDGTTEGTDFIASPVVFDGMVFAPLSRGIGAHRVPLHFLDASDGTIIKTFYAITEEEEALGYGGAGIWATAVVDLDEKYLYAGTADSEAFKRQHPRNQAIVKIDADRNRSTFGTIVDAYSGVPERYVDPLVPGLEKNPLCEMFGGPDDPLAGTSPSSSNSCLELDLDFGASPSFFIDDEGNKLIAELQKAGVFHVVRADTMQPQWVRILSAPMALGNATTAAYDGNDLFVAANPNSMFSFEKTFGFPNWLSSTASDAARFQPMTVANGVLYTQNNAGSLIAVDAATGLTLLNRPVTVDADGAPCVSLGGGVAVARNTVYAQCDTSGWVVAYRPQASPMP